MIVVAQHITVVGSKADQCIVVHSSFFQCLDNLSDLVVDKSDISIIVPAGFDGIFIAQVGKCRIFLHLVRFFVFSIFTAPVAYRRSRYIGILIHVEITLRRIIRTVRTGKRYFQEEGLIVVIITDQFTSCLSCPGRGMQSFI